ncbi:beta-1,4-glucuronyltransferase 1-like [Leptopilina heterotoma]|uniref:beta-1,4-glucuronyltransferase 1-like n=1 Tax=Leptopilina heterotoma TaxID=63436 RepID=UPI001CA93519|nr:beta-1,4-glucuronyltransferase 1-like [Leptopilina heterotoma]XP_043472899.1 beta-1,4-glucuronyltransferase 1-like [Leptopilina heterotoma]
MLGGTRRLNWSLRLSLVFNVCVILYVCVYYRTTPGPWVDETPSNWSLNQIQPLAFIDNINVSNSSLPFSTISSRGKEKHSANHFKKDISQVQKSANHFPEEKKKKILKTNLENKLNDNNTDHQNETIRAKTRSSSSLEEAIPCREKSMEPRISQRGDYWVLYNYVPMNMFVHCWESVTYSTHADYTFFDNLEPLLDRWRAPISIALHAPGTDFQPTIDSIKYARSCGSPLVSQLVTFHIYFSSKHMPKTIPSRNKIISEQYNCSLTPPWVNVSVSKLYKTEKRLLYPVNLGRNVARESAVTHYVLASDIELYPSPNLPEKFLEMIRRKNQPSLSKPNPKVFVLSIFEVTKTAQPPTNKTILLQMLKSGKAIPFHKKVCPGCHNIPKSKEWQEAAETEGLNIFHVGKRAGTFVHWEPIFIGTNNDPLYDERLSWEGRSDKMPQGYALCVLDYDFLILDNAFLVHRPGIKVYKKDARRDMLTAKTNQLIRKIIVPELKVLYGTRNKCAI